MKISKLFHWLYAILMLLPICGVFFKVGYVMLNENAYQSYSGKYTYSAYSQIITLNDNTTLTNMNGAQYYLNTSVNSTLTYYFTDESNAQSSLAFSIDDVDTFNSLNNTNIPSTAHTIVLQNYEVQNFFKIGYSTYSISTDSSSSDLSYIFNSFTTDSNVDVGSICRFNLVDDYIYFFTTYSDRNSKLLANIYASSYVVDTTLSSVFYSSLQELDSTEFFSWAKNSFLVKPIMYIGNLFGITSPHPIFTLMSYWLAISIIWLVFDLVMYLPLLVHRWLDKGVIE